ncbi:MAG TPA: hypothetical protein VN038_26640, partial [Dyadobacter sp.]|nr:hypothetical protein [Dyadobacter sp.]
MINKKNALRAVLMALLCVPALHLHAQNQWTYDFNNGFLPIENGGPALKPLGRPGQIIKEQIP